MATRLILFDLDQTLIDTAVLERYRKDRLWSESLAHASETRIYPGIQDLMRALGAIGMPVGVVTSSPRPYAERMLCYHGLQLPVVVAYHDTQRHKPFPDPLLRSAEVVGVGPTEMLYVGDAVEDQAAATAAGAGFVCALWGGGSKGVTDCIAVKSPLEVLGHIASLRPRT